MRHILPYFAVALFNMIAVACNDNAITSNTPKALAAFNTVSLGKHIAALSGDDFLVRNLFTEGATAANHKCYKLHNLPGLINEIGNHVCTNKIS